jgi:NADH-quinone oxidoreductase subunit K
VIPTAWFLALALLLFALGLAAFFIKRDLLTMFLAVEIMINAAGLAFLSLARDRGDLASGQAVVLFVITVAAAEAAVGLAVVLLVFRRRGSVEAEDIRDLKG